MPALIEPTSLESHGLRVGYLYIDGAGFRVGTESADGFQRHMSLAAARRLANTLEDTAEAEALKPVIDLLRDKADRLEEWLEGRAQLPEALAAMDTAGTA